MIRFMALVCYCFQRQSEELVCGIGVLCRWAQDEVCRGEARGSLVGHVNDSN